jgi:hypothetical protein
VDADGGNRLHVVDVVMSSFPSSTRYEAWITRLRQPWMATIGRRIFGGFAAALGDRALDWATQANLEHLPRYASPPSVALIASERQLDTYPNEPTATLAARAPQWIVLGKFAGSPLGLLLGLHFAGFDGAVLVQQNGLAYQLTLPLPAFVDGATWDPTPNLVITPCAQLAVGITSSVTLGRSVPSSNSWWTFDANTDLCSRFAILFPGALPSYFTTFARVPFSAVDNGAAVWNNAFLDTTYKVRVDGVTVTDGGGPVSVVADPTTQTPTGITLRASAAFTGYVDVIAYQAGANPYADLHPADLQRLQATIRKWRPGRAICVGVYALVQGAFFAWPPQAQQLNTMGPCTIVAFSGA